MFQRPPRSKWEICFVSVKLALPILSLSLFFSGGGVSWAHCPEGLLHRHGSSALLVQQQCRTTSLKNHRGKVSCVCWKTAGFIHQKLWVFDGFWKTIGFWWFLKNHRFYKACAEKPSRKGFVRVLKNRRFYPSKTMGFWWFLKNHRFLMVFEKPSVL